MALNIIINKVNVAASFAAGATVATAVASGGTTPYVYSLATGSDKFAINGSTGVVTVIAAMDIDNIASFSVTATDSTSGTPQTITSSVVYPPIQAKVQNKFNKSNVIYKITKDIDLGNGTLTIPSGCTLDFQGGSFSNGSLNGNQTSIKTLNSKIFNNINFDGIWNVEESYPEWFGAKGDGVTNDSIAIQNSIIIGRTITLSSKYFVDKTLNLRSNIKIVGINDGEIIFNPVDITSHCMYASEKTNIVLNNIKITNNYSSEAPLPNTYPTTLRMEKVSNLIVENCKIYNSISHAINCLNTGSTKNIIKDNFIYNPKTNAITINGSEITVKNNRVEGGQIQINAEGPLVNSTIVDNILVGNSNTNYNFRAYSNSTNLIVSNNNCRGASVISLSLNTSDSYNLIASNNIIQDSTKAFQVYNDVSTLNNQLIISNNLIINCVTGIVLNQSNNVVVSSNIIRRSNLDISSTGISCSNIKTGVNIIGNVFDNLSNGTMVYSSIGAILQNNTFKDIEVFSVKCSYGNLYLYNSTFSNNISGSSKVNYITLDKVEYGVIRNNVLNSSNNVDYPIRFSSHVDDRVSTLVIQYNIFYTPLYVSDNNSNLTVINGRNNYVVNNSVPSAVNLDSIPNGALSKSVVYNGYIKYNPSKGLTLIKDGEYVSAMGTSLATYGVSSRRPTSNIVPGFQYYDSTLNKPIWWNGSGWVNADGTALT